MIYKQIFINAEYNFSTTYEPEVIIDAGANIGLASIYFANKYPDAKIIAVEPEESNFELLLKNIRQYENIIPIHAALWNANEEIDILNSGLGECGFMVTDNKNNSVLKTPKADLYQKVSAVTINKIIDDYKLNHIDVLKIDIEGAEKEIFEDSLGWISKVKSIIIELHEYMKMGCNRSFYNNTNGFDAEWHQGENIYLSRNNYIIKR
jgi:FkbM family methyltransferase